METRSRSRSDAPSVSPRATKGSPQAVSVQQSAPISSTNPALLETPKEESVASRDETGVEIKGEPVSEPAQEDPEASDEKRRLVKNLKQIIATEKTTGADGQPRPTYGSIDIALNPHRPPKKYSDVSGYEAKYADPETGLRYATPEEFAVVRKLPTDVVNGYLALRGAEGIL